MAARRHGGNSLSDGNDGIGMRLAHAHVAEAAASEDDAEAEGADGIREEAGNLSPSSFLPSFLPSFIAAFPVPPAPRHLPFALLHPQFPTKR